MATAVYDGARVEGDGAVVSEEWSRLKAFLWCKAGRTDCPPHRQRWADKVKWKHIEPDSISIVKLTGIAKRGLCLSHRLAQENS